MLDNNYCEKLQRVLDQLLLQRAVSLDDTCLQKLIDQLRILLKDKDVNINIFHDFLLNVKLDDDCLDENVKTFAVHLFGVLGEKEAIFKCLMDKELIVKSFEKFGQCVCSEDLSILTATFTSLRHITAHFTGLQWFLKTTPDAIDIAFNVLKCGRSVFIVSSAQKFLVKLLQSLIKFQQHTEDSFVHCCNKHYSQILKDVWTLTGSFKEVPLSINKISVNTDQLIGLQLVKAIYLENNIPDLNLNKEKIDIIITCLSEENNIAISYALDILESSYLSAGTDLVDYLENRIESTAVQLLSQGKILTALQIAQRLFYRFPKSKRKTLETLALSPLTVLFSSDTSGDVATKIMAAMKTKSDFTRVMSSAILSITHQERKDALLKIAQLLRGTVWEIVPGLVDKYRYLHENRRIQRDILETIQQCVQDVRSEENVMGEICRGLLSVTEDSNTPVQVLMVIFKTWKNVLTCFFSQKCGKIDSVDNKGDNKCDHTKGDNCNVEEKVELCMEELLNKLAVSVEKKMCDLQWEVRDTAVEFIGELLDQKDNQALLGWMKSHKLHVSLWQCVRDQESYVRATTLRGITRLIQAEPISLQAVISMDVLVRKCCEIIETDSEAFPRRAAVDLLSVLYSLSEFPEDGESYVWATMSQAAAKDFDWDVQLKAMDFWQNFIDRKLTQIKDDSLVPEYAKLPTNSCLNGLSVKRKPTDSSNLLSKLEELEKSGALSVLLFCLKDADQSVQEKACKMLLKVKENLSTNCEQVNWDSETSFTKKTKPNQLPVEGSLSESKTSRTLNAMSIKNFMLELESMDLEKIWSEISQSCDEYVKNPDSLLDDILTSFCEKENDTVMDCY